MRSSAASTPRTLRPGILPQAGRVLLYRQPQRPGIRIDSGVVEGSDVSVHYDPMIAKVIAHAETRDGAIDRMRAALSGFHILGLPTNIAFLSAVLDSRAFREGRVHTAYLDGEGAALSAPVPLPAAALAAAVIHDHTVRLRQPGERPRDVPRPMGIAAGLEGLTWRTHATSPCCRATLGHRSACSRTDESASANRAKCSP